MCNKFRDWNGLVDVLACAPDDLRQDQRVQNAFEHLEIEVLLLENSFLRSFELASCSLSADCGTSISANGDTRARKGSVRIFTSNREDETIFISKKSAGAPQSVLWIAAGKKIIL